MKREVSDKDITFRCKPCNQVWDAPPGRIEDAPEREHHPWRYFALCPKCGAECTQVYWQVAQFSAWAKGVPSPSPEARAASAERFRNMEHTPEMNRRTRFNRMKHGLYAKVATYFPQRPGGYPHCNGCPYLDQGCGTWDHGACLRRTELYMRHRIAFQQGDPKGLVNLRADLQASIQAILDDMILAIIKTGVELRSPKWYTDSEGNFCLAEYTDSDGNRRLIEEINAHPLLKPLFELLSRNNLSLGDMRMTPKAQEEDQELAGFIAHKEQQDEVLSGFAERQTLALESLKGLIEHSRTRQATDPVLLEHQRAGDGDG